MRTPLLLFVLAAVFLAGCRSEVSAPKAAEPMAAPAPAAASKPRIVFLGDSLTAGLGLGSEQGYPALIAKRLVAEGFDYEVVNAGVSGDTSAGGLRRLEWSLEGDVRILVVALGANDGLRGLSPAELKKNLEAVIARATAAGVTVILAGMEAPPNFGADYTRQFRDVYGDLAAAHRVRLLPFLLQGVAGEPALNQADGIHPNARGAQMVAELVWAELKPLLVRPNDQASSPKPQASIRSPQ
jgi:acyl-CoA thioesterase-1